MKIKPVFAVVPILVAVLFCHSVFAQNANEDLLNEWVAAFNAEDPNQLKVFYQKVDYPYQAARVTNFQRMTGGFDLLEVKAVSDASITALVAFRISDEVAEIQIEVKGEDKPKIARINVRAVPRPEEYAIKRLSETEALQSVMEKAKAMTEEDLFSGALLIAKGDKVLLDKAFGFENREKSIPNTPNTKFRLGSMNKMFTAVAVLQLLDAGKVSLDASVGDYLPDYPNEKIRSQVSVRHLLTHTGGTGDIFGPNWDEDRLALKTHGDYLQRFGEREPQFEPGSTFRYSNYGYVLLGIIIEAISGQTYYEFVRENILDPMEMNDTGFYPEAQEVEGRSVGYIWQNGEWIDNKDTLPWRGMAAGGGYSTTGDLLKFGRGLLDNTLISESTLAQASTPHLNNYGFGFGISGENTLRGFGHGGGAPGMNSSFTLYPELGYVVIAISNFDPPAAQRLAMQFQNRMPVE